MDHRELWGGGGLGLSPHSGAKGGGAMFMVFFGDFDFNFTGGEEFLHYRDFVF